MRRFIDILLFLLLSIAFGCSEVYNPDDIESAQPIPVIQGIIMENEIPRVKLSWTRAHGDDGPQFIIGAVVKVFDQYGNFCLLEETGNGNYMPFTDAIQGYIGNTYTLTVDLPDGRSFISNPQYLQRRPVVDSLYADPGKTEVVTYNSEGKPIVEKAEGLEILADLSDYGSTPMYYRFNTTSLKQMVKTVDIGTPASHSVYMWETRTMDNTYSVENSFKSLDRQLVLRHDAGFLRYFYDVNLETPTSTAPFTEAWVITFNIYSISGDVYEYYNSISRQLGSDDQIFAPIASQVKSNIRCTTDPMQKVAGVFEACSRTTLYKAFGWKTLNEYKSKNLVSFPQNLGAGEQLYWPPDFWIYF